MFQNVIKRSIIRQIVRLGEDFYNMIKTSNYKTNPKIERRFLMKRLSKKTKLFLFLLVIIMIMSFIVITALKLINKDFTIKDSRKEIGYTYVLNSQINNTEYNLRYPFFRYEKIDNMIYNELQNQIKNFNKANQKSSYKTTIQSDFNDFVFNDKHCVSIDLRFLERSHHKKQETVKTLIFCYGKKIQAKNIFLQDKIKNIVSKIKNEIRSNQTFASHLKDKSVNLDEKIPNNIS